MVNRNRDTVPYEKWIKGVSLLLVLSGAMGAMWIVNGQLLGKLLESSLLVADPLVLMGVFVLMAVAGIVGIAYTEGVLTGLFEEKME